MALTAEQEVRRLALQTAYDAIIAGRGVQRIEYNGQVTHYAAGNIAALQSELALLNIDATTRPSRRRGAVGFRF